MFLKHFRIISSLLLFLLVCISFASPPKTIYLHEINLKSMTSGYKFSRINRSVEGNPISIAGKSYSKGVGTHAPSKMNLLLDGKIEWFMATVGVDDETCSGGSVRYLLTGNNRTLWDSGIIKYGQFKECKVRLKNITQLQLQVLDGGDGNNCDYADWGDARFIYKGKVPEPMTNNTRWKLNNDEGITWDILKDSLLPHEDHIEMSGQKVSVILRYGVGPSGESILKRHIVWPMLRTIPNNTHASLSFDFNEDYFPKIQINSQELKDIKPTRVDLNGLVTIHTKTHQGIELEQVIFPSRYEPVIWENYTLKNTQKKDIQVVIPPYKKEIHTPAEKGVDGSYTLISRVIGDGSYQLKPGETCKFSLCFSGQKKDEILNELDPMKEENLRRSYVQTLYDNLQFECPDPVLSKEFAFAKIRAAESIFKTQGGLMHGPGGGAYYAAIWANDQAEYANPFFPYLGDAAGNDSALNSFRHFARFMKEDYKPIPSSIIAEGKDIWNGAGDRGDAAMVAYGAARYALALGDETTAQELWPRIMWCLEYCHRKTTKQGVIASDKDELEGRFPAGDANLCTSSLTYDALISAIALGKNLGVENSTIQELQQRADNLKKALNKHFGANISGFDTYRYYEGNTTLRAWICIPLTMGIYERKEGTINALFSPKLWTQDGLATEAGKETFWDRSTLYGFRGVFAAGDIQKALPYFQAYSNRRLLGDHVPYPVEAWPEGNQRHLSAESALYCRVITEGLFGIRPTGLHSFELTPRLPQDWNHMSLKHIRAFGKNFDIEIIKKGKSIIARVSVNGKIIQETPVIENTPIQVQLNMKE